MRTEFELPDVGEGVAEGELVTWHVAVGDTVEEDQVLAEGSLAIEMGTTLEDIADTVHPHPTLSEAVTEAVENAREQAIHTLNRKPALASESVVVRIGTER